MRPQLYVIVGVADSLQGIRLAHIQGRNVGVAQTQALLQVWIPLKKILVSSYLFTEMVYLSTQ